jgi:hypothetical protein
LKKASRGHSRGCWDNSWEKGYCYWLQVRGFTPIGMIECWNIGKMGIGVLQYWVIDYFRLDLKVRTDKIFQKPTIPSFYYSRIEANKHTSKKYILYSACYRNSEMFNNTAPQ